MVYDQIHIYLRQTSHNRLNTTRPGWFDYERTFRNLLRTTKDIPFVKLTVVFDGEPENHFTLKYFNAGFRLNRIDTSSFKGFSYEDTGSAKSTCLVCDIVKRDNLPESALIYFLENDYLHLEGWPQALLDLYSSTDQNHYASLYDHLDKYIFTDPKAADHWGMYRDLQSKIILASGRYWRTVPSITSSWILPKKFFDRDFDVLSIGISDNTGCSIVEKRDGTKFFSPLPGLATHCQEPFLAPFVDWKSVQETLI